MAVIARAAAAASVRDIDVLLVRPLSLPQGSTNTPCDRAIRLAGDNGSGMSSLPRVIQGGMGVGISNWRLAQAVSRTGELGVVSGTALDQILSRRLQDGDPGGHMRRALNHFPVRGMAERVWETY